MSYGGKEAKKNKARDYTSNFMAGRNQFLDDYKQEENINSPCPKNKKSKSNLKIVIKSNNASSENVSKTITNEKRFSKTQQNL